MDSQALLGLFNNAALLLALALLIELTRAEAQPETRLRQMLIGVGIGVVAIALMANAWPLDPDFIFDARSVLLSVSGLFFGMVPTLIAVTISAAFRIYYGGSGMLAGLLIISSTASIGLLWRRWRPPTRSLGVLELYGFGLVVHIAMLLCLWTLPSPVFWSVLQQIALPVLLAFPLATVLLGRLLSYQFERRRAQEALRASEEKLRCYLDYAPLGVFITDQSGRYVEVNPAAGRMLGYSEAELLGMTIPQVLAPEAHAAGMAHFACVRASGSASGELLHRRRDGSPIWLRVDAVRLNEHRFMAFCEDVSARRATEAALRASEENLRVIFEQAAVGVALIDSRSGRFLRINRHYCEMIGYTVAEMSSGCSFQDITHPDDLPLDLGNMRRLLAGEIREFVMEKRYFHKDGHVVWVTLSVSPTWAPGETPCTHVAVVQDITDRKRAEAELRLKSAALESSLAGFDIVSEEGLFLYVNAAYLRLWGYERPDEVLATLPTEHCADPAMPAHIMATLQAQGEGTFEFTARRRDGSTFDVLMACHMLRDERNRVLYTGSSLDISERRRIEAEIRNFNTELEQRVRERTAQLEAANQALETFVYSVAHDLKAPLRGIDGYGRLLQQECAGGLPGDGSLFIDNIRRATQQMGLLIDDLLAYARLDRRALRRELINLPALVAAAVDEHAAEIQHLAATVRVEVPPLWPRADPDGLAQVLRDLLENALKFHRPAVPLEIEIGGRRTVQGTAMLWIRDNGIGFELKFHDRIFEIFQRLQRAEDYPGTGIGLAIVRKAVERMDGRVWAESVPGAGATFFLELPL
ncbi:MAG: PAS domain S-box protein [Candidatus Competibacteraceae bacterium]|nr:MAG: PAS domain S-box protein [Candidatus Competibacteraceae bacterium]